ncbi:MAG: hypothetical protein ABL931_06585 [Usitatibacteraceae bacterium]
MIPIEDVTLAQCVTLLEARRKWIDMELHDYVRPVPACDVDYNTMLAERAALAAALSHLHPLCRGEMNIPHPREDLVAH